MRHPSRTNTIKSGQPTRKLRIPQIKSDCMPLADSQHWNKKYTEEIDMWLANQPHPLVLDYADLISAKGHILDAASGVGADALYLAQKGHKVFAVDIAYVGLHAAQERFREHHLEYRGAVVDLSGPWLPPNRFDAILNFYFLERATFPVYRRALKPGGLLFFETFQKNDQPRKHPQYYLDPEELITAFADFEILKFEQRESSSDSGKLIAQLVARKRIQ